MKLKSLKFKFNAIMIHFRGVGGFRLPVSSFLVVNFGLGFTLLPVELTLK